MREFKRLPTDQSFRELTDHQINLMIYSMNEDHRQLELARKGLTVDSEHYDTSFEEEVWNRDVGDWEVLREGHDADAIAKQVEELTRAEDQANLATKFDSLEEYNAFREAGGKTTRETEVEQYMNKRIAEALDKAKMLEATKGKGKLVDDRDRPEAKGGLNDNLAELDKKAIDDSIALFNSMDDDDEFSAL